MLPSLAADSTDWIGIRNLLKSELPAATPADESCARSPWAAAAASTTKNTCSCTGMQYVARREPRHLTTRRLSEMAWRNCILLHERLDVDRLADGRRRTKARLLDLRITQHSALLRRSRVRIDQADRRKSINAYCEAQMKVDNPHRDLLERFVF